MVGPLGEDAGGGGARGTGCRGRVDKQVVGERGGGGARGSKGG